MGPWDKFGAQSAQRLSTNAAPAANQQVGQRRSAGPQIGVTSTRPSTSGPTAYGAGGIGGSQQNNFAGYGSANASNQATAGYGGFTSGSPPGNASPSGYAGASGGDIRSSRVAAAGAPSNTRKGSAGGQGRAY